MGRFEYQGLTESGRLMSGQIEAASADEAAAVLAGMRVEVRSVRESPAPRPDARIGRAELVLFNQQLASIAKAGLPLDRGLREIAADIQKRSMRSMVLGLADDIAAGVSAEEAFSRRRSLPPLYGQIVKAGIKSGRLGEMLISLNRHLEVQGRTRRIIVEAITYPAVVLTFAAILLTIVFAKIVPSFTDIFASFGARLPALTEMFIYLSRHVIDFWLTVGAIIGAGVLISLGLSATAWGRRAKESAYLAVPVLGRLYHRSLLSRLADTMALLVGSGCDMPAAARLAFAATGSQTLKDEGDLMAQAIERGEDLPSAGAFCLHVPPLFFYSMQAAAQRNELQDSLYSLSDMYAQQALTHQSRLQGLLMPVMIIFVGCVIATALTAMFLPLISFVTSVS